MDIFSLNKLQSVKYNSFESQNTCLKYKPKKGAYGPVTNPRFKLFDQNYFHAGDDKDIDKFALLPLRYNYSDELFDESFKLDKLVKSPIFKLYKNIDYVSVHNSFTYLFEKFKKGIFVIIKDNKLLTYLPFSNANYKNDWVQQTYFSESEKKLLKDYNNPSVKKQLDNNIFTFQNKHPEQFRGRKINLDRSKWYANNCLFRNQFPEYEGELNTNVFKDLLVSLTQSRKIPDVEFFINDRDFPLLKKDLTHPYEHLFDGDNKLIDKNFKFSKMAPIFSKSTTKDFADLLIPTNDDWVLASNKFFLPSCSNKPSNINLNWKSKKNICIFRGSATGCGNTIDNNMRLRAAHISLTHNNILDAGITDWKQRMKKFKDQPINILNPSDFDFKLATKIDDSQKSNFKFILNIDGYVSAFRLSSELSMMSVVLLVDSPYKMWFSHKLIPHVHYIPIKHDLTDLIDQINWCIKNDDKCLGIATNAKAFFDKELSRDGIFDYLQSQFINIYNNKNFKNLLHIKIPLKKKNIAIISCFRDQGDGLREKQRKHFVTIMNKILAPYCNFKIFIIQQSADNNSFNIGKLKNIGFELAMKENDFDNYIFSDIDTIPNYDLIQYFIVHNKFPIALGMGTRYYNANSSKPFMGALLNFNSKTFIKINGYMNNIYGWGKEDESLINRLVNSKFETILYPKNGMIIDLETHLSINNKLKTVKKNNISYEKLYEDLRSFKKNGLNSLNYKILNTTNINNNTIQIEVDLLKHEDEKKYPHLYNFNFGDKFSDLYKDVKNTLKLANIKFI